MHNFPSTTAFIIIPFDDIMVDTKNICYSHQSPFPFPGVWLGARMNLDYP